jgi:hypothetical protein
MSDSLSEIQNTSIIERRISIKQVEENIHEVNIETDLKKMKSLNRFDKRDGHSSHTYHSSVLIPKENLTGLISRLASLSKLDCRKEGCSTGNTSNTTAGNPESQKNVTKSKKHRETVLLDQKLNIQEILNDKNSLLLTEENILERSDMSRDDHLLRMSDKKEYPPSINNFNNLSFSIDDQIDVQLTDNNINNINPDQIRLSQQFETFNKKKPVPRNEEGHLTNRLSKNSPIKKNAKTDSKIPVLKTNNLKYPFSSSRDQSLKPKNNLDSKSTILKNGKSVINSKSKSPLSNKISNPFSSSRTTFTPNAKLKTSEKKNVMTKNLKDSKISPFNEKKVFKPKPNISNTLNKSINRSTSNNKKGFLDNSKNLNTLNSSRLDTLNTSISKKHKKNESLINHSSMLSSEFNVIEEYDYHKILTELRAIFGEDLEFFDENSMFILKMFSAIFKFR